MTKVKHLSERTIKAKISKSTGKQFHRIIHPTKPPSVYLSLKPQNEMEVRYIDLEPQRALKVVRIDSFLDYMKRYIKPDNPLELAQVKQIEEALRFVRDILIREGKALGR